MVVYIFPKSTNIFNLFVSSQRSRSTHYQGIKEKETKFALKYLTIQSGTTLSSFSHIVHTQDRWRRISLARDP